MTCIRKGSRKGCAVVCIHLCMRRRVHAFARVFLKGAVAVWTNPSFLAAP